MKLTTWTALVIAQVATITLAQDEKGEETRRYDIRALSRALTDTQRSFPFTSPPNRPGGAGEVAMRTSFRAEDEEAPVSGDPLVTALVTFALEERIDPNGPNAPLLAVDGKLHVTGNPNFQESVARLLGDLGGIVTPTVEVELSLLPVEALAATPSAVLDASKIERVLAIAKPIAVLRTRVRPGSDTVFEAVARRAYLKEYDTEVAQHSKAFDPLVDVVLEGTRVRVSVNILPSGEYHVSVRGQQSESDGPPRLASIVTPGAGTLQLPRMFWASTSASARVPDRGALVIGNDVVTKSAWAVRIFGGTASPPGPDSATMRLVPIGAAIASTLSDSPPSVGGPGVSGVTGSAVNESEATPRINAEILVEDVLGLRPDGVAAPERRARLAGRYLALDGAPKFIAAAGELVSKIVSDATRGVGLEIRYGAVPAAEFTVPAPDDLGVFATTLPHRAVTAATYGDRVIVLSGQSHSYLKDLDVEIAEKSTIDDPIVEVFFTGLSMSARPLLVGADRCALDVAFDYQEMLEMLPVSTGTPDVSELELPRIAAVRARVPVDGLLGTWQLVHTAPIEGTDRQFVMMLRAQAY